MEGSRSTGAFKVYSGVGTRKEDMYVRTWEEQLPCLHNIVAIRIVPHSKVRHNTIDHNILNSTISFVANVITPLFIRWSLRKPYKITKKIAYEF